MNSFISVLSTIAQGSGAATISSPPATATAAPVASSFGDVLDGLFAPTASVAAPTPSAPASGDAASPLPATAAAGDSSAALSQSPMDFLPTAPSATTASTVPAPAAVLSDLGSSQSPGLEPQTTPLATPDAVPGDVPTVPGTVTPATAGAPTPATADQPAGGFTTPSAAAAKLLTAPSTGAAASTTAPSTSTLVGALKALFGKTAGTTTGITSTAAPGAATAPTTASSDAGTPPALLRNVVSTLTELDKDKQQGVVPSKGLLKQAQDAVEALSGFLASQQTVATPLATPPAASPASGQATTASPITGSAGTSAATGAAAAGTAAASTAGAGDATAAATNAELAQLSDKLQSLASTVGKDQSDLGTDLTQLAKLLDPKTLAPATATQLGFASDGTPAATGLTAAINGLVHGKAAPVLGQPALAAPSLKIASEATKAGTPAADAGKSSPSEGADTASRATKPDSPKASDADAAAAAKPDTTPTPIATTSSADDKSAAGAASSPTPASGAAAMVAAATSSPATTSPAASAATDLRQAQTAYQIADPMAANLPQMAFEIARHARQGSDQFQISMDPKDLGRVDVKLAMDATTGAVTAHLTADRPETLDLLKRDAGTLGQALSQAGLDAGKTNLQFSLNQNPSPRQDARQDGTPSSFATGDDSASSLAAIAPAAAYQGMATGAGLNIFV